MPCTKPEYVACVFRLIPTVTQGGKDHHPHFPDEEAEVSKGQEPLPSISRSVGKPTPWAPLSLQHTGLTSEL